MQLHRSIFWDRDGRENVLWDSENNTKPIKLLQTACAAQSICSALWFQESNIYLLDFSLVLYYAKSHLIAGNITSNADGNTFYG